MAKIPIPLDAAQGLLLHIHQKITDGTATEEDCKLANEISNQAICDACPLPAVDVPRAKIVEVLKNQVGERDYAKMQIDFDNGIGDDFNIALDFLYGALNIPQLNIGNVGQGKIRDAIQALEKLAPADYWKKGNVKPLA